MNEAQGPRRVTREVASSQRADLHPVWFIAVLVVIVSGWLALSYAKLAEQVALVKSLRNELNATKAQCQTLQQRLEENDVQLERLTRLPRLEAEVTRLHARLQAEKKARANWQMRYVGLQASAKKNTLYRKNIELESEIALLKALVVHLASPENDSWQSEDSFDPPVAENGDIAGADNDGDGRSEPVYVRGYYRSDGTHVRGHYRARPRQ